MIDAFKKVLIFLQAMYKDACNKKTVFGFYGDFGACIGGSVYLLYLLHCLMETGNKALLACAYLTTDDRLKHGSMEPIKPLSHPDSKATEQSHSPIQDGLNFHTKKYITGEATEQAATPVGQRKYKCYESTMFDRMMQMKSSSKFYSNMVKKLISLSKRSLKRGTMARQRRCVRKFKVRGSMPKQC